jgi:hypothetical protein
VPIRLFLERDHSFGPEDIASMSAAGGVFLPRCISRRTESIAMKMGGGVEPPSVEPIPLIGSQGNGNVRHDGRI